MKKQLPDFIVQRGYLVAYHGKDTAITIPEGVTCIGNKAFYRSQVAEVVVPTTVVEIESDAFSQSDLKRITIQGDIQKVGANAFPYNEELNCCVFKQIPISRFRGENRDIAMRYFMEHQHLITNYEVHSGNITYIGKHVLDQLSSKTVGEELLKNEELFFEVIRSKAIPNKNLDEMLEIVTRHGSPQQVSAFLTLVEQTRGKRNDDDGKLDLTIDAVPTVSDWRKLFRFKYTDGFVEIIGCNIQDDIIEVPSMIGKKTVKTIGHRAFDGRKLPDRDSFEVILPTQRKIVIPDGVDEISRGAFYCINNREIVLPDTVTELPSGMLIAVHNVTLHLSANVKAIPDDLVWDSPDDCIRIIAPAGSFAEQYAIERGLLVV